jgi:hypothetical protein
MAKTASIAEKCIVGTTDDGTNAIRSGGLLMKVYKCYAIRASGLSFFRMLCAVVL